MSARRHIPLIIAGSAPAPSCLRRTVYLGVPCGTKHLSSCWPAGLHCAVQLLLQRNFWGRAWRCLGDL